MACSEAQREANRQNSQRSTGPKTLEGKEASRRNALKHGMTGAGVVIPGEDQFLVAERFEDLAAKFAPDDDPFALVLAQKAAMLWVRGERCYRHDVAATAERVRNAGAAFDETRRTEADHLFETISASPATNVRRLWAMPEGVDLLLGEYRKLRDIAGRGTWTTDHAGYLDHCMGHRPKAVSRSRCEVLDRAIQGKFDELRPEDGAGLDPVARARWAKGEMVRLIDAEIALLEAHRGTLDLEAIAISRAEAGERALIATSPEALLDRKYEAATERALFRALHELKQIRRERDRKPKPTPPVMPQSQPTPPDPFPNWADLAPELASFWPDLTPVVLPPDFVPIPVTSPEPEPRKSRYEPGKRPKLPRR